MDDKKRKVRGLACPPARVDSKKQNMSESFLLYASQICWRSFTSVSPSSRGLHSSTSSFNLRTFGRRRSRQSST